jgi:hypothetical protein
VVRIHSLGNLYFASGGHVTGCRLEEEERFLGDGVVQLLDMVDVVPAYGDDLCIYEKERNDETPNCIPFFLVEQTLLPPC